MTAALAQATNNEYRHHNELCLFINLRTFHFRFFLFLTMLIFYTHASDQLSALKNYTRERVKPSLSSTKILDEKKKLSSTYREYVELPLQQVVEDEADHHNEKNQQQQSLSSVLVFTSLTGIYVWWPMLFGGDDTFHLIFTQDDVPRFHDVIGDELGNIYLTAPHERTVYRLQYTDGWWRINDSLNHQINSIRSEMPLFLNIHYISSLLYVYGHRDIQIIDLLERRSRGSAPFMKRLRELSPNLRITDLIIDQIKSDGYIIGDSYGWCTIIRCLLTINECTFLYKIPSSYDNRPYSCSATIDFKKKLMYLSLEEKILIIYLNEQTNYDRRILLTDKNGPRSTLGYDDICFNDNYLFYTDVLRALLHICSLNETTGCLNISLTILPLRMNIVHVKNLKPPPEEQVIEIHVNQTTTPLLTTITLSDQTIMNDTTTQSQRMPCPIDKSNLKMVIGFLIGILVSVIGIGIYISIIKIMKKSGKERTTIGKLVSGINGNNGSNFSRQPLENPTDKLIPSSDSSDSSSSYKPDTIL
ncbi:unnamed protein product [Didymodactylos carnosus]|uniref:Uncharacterized protein n=1 Tax=Didymodactylos carnosus TaxID=1234261 RepID=A0A813TXG4_9BILA|nr:unnamed protein product [Didymodactylos carnosus]CAF1162093.1 unnamed protein product [Didymodactylos carnosus]CAF3600612.1 unnamed protein product [Didymodactylos carnosus]CAF3973783.1 unnamed protein product [Didymodactylos carnosus]